MLNLNINSTTTSKLIIPKVLYDGNTVAWYDYLIGVTKDGSNLVSKWEDKLGSGHDLLQATGSYQPLWSNTGIQFDGIDDYLKTVPFTFNQPEFVYIVFKQNTHSNLDYVLDGNTVASLAFQQVTPSPDLKVYAGVLSPADSNLTLNTYGIARILANGASSKFQINDNTAWTGDLGANNMGAITLATRGDALANFGHICIKEAIFRKVADGSTDETNIYNYLARKYNII